MHLVWGMSGLPVQGSSEIRTQFPGNLLMVRYIRVSAATVIIAACAKKVSTLYRPIDALAVFVAFDRLERVGKPRIRRKRAMKCLHFRSKRLSTMSKTMSKRTRVGK